MSSVRVQTGATERIEVLILDATLDPLTGKSDILISIRRVSDGFFYDFNDDTFKSSGWTTRQTAMSEISATNAPGEYSYDFDTSAITNAAADDTYQIRVDQSPGTDAANVPQIGEVKVGQFVDDIDAAISSRAVPGDEMDLIDDAITSAKYDEATAFPLAQADTGASAVARTGADADTLETLSDQIDGLNDLAIADVQTALTNQGYTAGRAPNLDNLDATISSRAAPGDAMDLVADAVDAAALASSAVAEIVSGVWGASLPGTFGAGEAGYILGTNLDAQVSTRSSHSASDVDTQLSGSHGAGSWEGATAAATAAAVWSEALPGAYGAGEAGKLVGDYLDAAVSSRAAPGDAMDLITDALDAAALATSALAELNTYLEVTAGHGAGSWAGSSASTVAAAVWAEALPGAYGVGEAGRILGDNLDAQVSTRSIPGDAMDLITDALDSTSLAGTAVSEIANGVWVEPVPGSFGAGQAGKVLGDYLDATVSSRAVPGDAMDLVTDALDAAALATSALAELNTYLEVTASHGAGAWTAATVSPAAIATAVWTEALPGVFGAGSAGYLLGTNLDALVSSRATQADILSDATPFAGADIDAAISSRSSHTAGDVDTQLSGAHGAGSWEGISVADIWGEALPGAFGAGTAGYLLGTNLDALVSSRSSHDAADVDTQLSGTHGAGSWEGPTEAVIAAEVDSVLTAAHGAGSWQTTSISPAAVAAAVWGEAFASYTTDTQFGYLVNKYLRALIEGDAKQDQPNYQWVVYDPDDGLDAGETELARFDTLNESGDPSNVQVYSRKKVP